MVSPLLKIFFGNFLQNLNRWSFFWDFYRFNFARNCYIFDVSDIAKCVLHKETYIPCNSLFSLLVAGLYGVWSKKKSSNGFWDRRTFSVFNKLFKFERPTGYIVTLFFAIYAMVSNMVIHFLFSRLKCQWVTLLHISHYIDHLQMGDSKLSEVGEIGVHYHLYIYGWVVLLIHHNAHSKIYE